MGVRPEGSNPCRGIRRDRRKGRARFLSDEELRRLSRMLSAWSGRYRMIGFPLRPKPENLQNRVANSHQASGILRGTASRSASISQ